MREGNTTPTLYIRCAALHSRGELLHEFFYAHRAALELERFYEVPSSSTGSGGHPGADAGSVPLSAASSPRLPTDFPVEAVYVRQSRKPYFLLEWRYRTREEVEKQKAAEDDSAHQEGVASTDQEAAPPPTASNASSSQNRLSADFLMQLAGRTLALGTKGDSGGNLTWREQPVTISAAMPGMTVAAERTKLELRDAQLKTQRVAEKRARDEVGAAKNVKGRSSEADKSTSSFVPRSVRRRV